MLVSERPPAFLWAFEWLFIQFSTAIYLLHDFYLKIRDPQPEKAVPLLDTTEVQLGIAWERLQSSSSHSLLRKHLTPDIYHLLKDRKTTSGVTLLDIIRSGIANLDSGVGIYAPNAESYSTFSPLFLRIIDDYHNIAAEVPFRISGARQPAVDFGGPTTGFVNLDPEGKYVISTRIRCARNFAEYPFNSKLTKKQYMDIERRVRWALERSLNGEAKGDYYPLLGMGEEVRKRLVDDRFLFKSGDRFLEAANANRFWPTGRGIFHNVEKTFLVWVNEEDHLRIISMEQGADLPTIYNRLVAALHNIEHNSGMHFARHPDLGYLTFCPTNLGTTIRASVHIRLPKLVGAGLLESVAEKYELQVRGTRGEHSGVEGGVYDISNKRRLGLTEFQAVRTLQRGILAMIEMEESL
ncbi:hypothetical protein TWF281_003891 [Arthrobotrys megalospora]